MYMEDRHWKKINIGVLILAGAAFLYLAVHRVFAYDEAYTIGMISRDFEDIVRVTARDVHSPFYYIVLRLFYLFPGFGGMIAAKLFSWLFMMAFLVSGGIACRKIYDRRVEFYWLIFAAFMPSMVIQATNARMYTMGMFLVSLGSYLAYSLYRSETRRKWIGFTLISIMAVYVHTFCMLEMAVVYMLFLIAAVVKKRYQCAVKLLASGVTVSIGFLPWLMVLYHQFRRWAGVESGWSNTIEKISLNSFKLYVAEWFSSLEEPRPYAMLFGVALMILAGCCVLTYVRKSRDYLPCFAVLVPGIVFLIAMLVSVFIVPCFLGRYLFPVFGGVWLFAAVGVSRIRYLWVRCVLLVNVVGVGGG